MAKAVRQSWVWRFDHPPEAVWPILADTARFNEAAGIPKHRITEAQQPDGSVHYLAALRFGPFRVSWRELPVEWVAERRFRHCREFLSGPFRSLCATLELSPEGGGSRVDYTLEAVPANLVGWLILRLGFMARTGRTFTGLADSVREHLAGARATPYVAEPPRLAAEAVGRIEAMVARIDEGSGGLGRRLADHLAAAQESDLVRIRPRALARGWGIDERGVIECCLEAVKAGLLEMRWDLLCTRCQGAKETVPSLDRLPRGAHCGSCNIDYERDFSKNVELTFQPAPTVRPIDAGEFCLFGPMTTPHVKVQQTVDAGASVEVSAGLAFGDYRLRTLHPGGETHVTWEQGGFPEVIAEGETVVAGPPSPDGWIRLSNCSAREMTLIVESREWARDALTAHRVTTMQAFRDLFSDAVLRPGDEVSITQVTLMFTDLKGSTAMYSRVGDAGAYHRVREHFAFLGKTVREHNGAIVKTIGDAVMAAFADPADGVRAALAIQRNLAALNAAPGDEPLVIKIGLHAGPCIAVTLNDRLDYFGSTVNLAARLQGESAGDDIVLSRALVADAVVTRLLRTVPAAEETALVRGFPEPVPFCRLGPGAVASLSAADANGGP